MKVFKNILYVCIFTVIFFVVQIFSTFFSLFIRVKLDREYAISLLNCIKSLNPTDTDSLLTYTNLISELIPSILIINAIILTVPFIIIIIKKKKKVFKPLKWMDILQYITLGVVLNVIISFIITLLPSNLINDYTSTTNYITTISFIPLLLSVGILAPIVEEIIFRYAMITKLKSKPLLALILPALLFGIVHGNLVQGSYAFALGILFGYIYLKTDNLLTTIILHIAINSSSVIATYLNMKWIVILSIISFVIFIILCIKNKSFLKTET